jgi:nitroreductase
MDVFEAIRTRRSIGKLKAERPPAQDIKRLLELAVWAPNHHLTEPWRFYVLAGAARQEMGEALEAALKAGGETDSAKLAAERAKPLRAPVVILVTCKPGKDWIEAAENKAATAAAVQNILLAAHAIGLGAQWRTGQTIYAKQVADRLGLEAGEEVIAAVYLGYPDMPLKEGRRLKSVEQVTTWHGW